MRLGVPSKFSLAKQNLSVLCIWGRMGSRVRQKLGLVSCHILSLTLSPLESPHRSRWCIDWWAFVFTLEGLLDFRHLTQMCPRFVLLHRNSVVSRCPNSLVSNYHPSLSEYFEKRWDPCHSGNNWSTKKTIGGAVGIFKCTSCRSPRSSLWKIN